MKTIIEYNNIKHELGNIKIPTARGILLRSRCKLVEEGEKNMACFLKIVKCNYCNKVISHLLVDNKPVTETINILAAEKMFCEDHYSADKGYCEETFQDSLKHFTV